MNWIWDGYRLNPDPASQRGRGGLVTLALITNVQGKGSDGDAISRGFKAFTRWQRAMAGVKGVEV